MTREILRMQMLSGIITESEYKAKLEEKKSLNEHYIAGGIVGVGAINNPFEGRKKEKYEDAFEYFLSQKYTLNEAEGDVMVDSATLASYIDELVSLADDMEYTPDMVKGLQDLKAGLPGGEMSVENALDIIKQTIEITEDDIDAIEALGQAVDYDDAIISKAREISGLDEGKEVKKDLNEAEEAQALATAEKVEDEIESDPKIEAALDNLSDEEKAQLSAELAKLGITPDASIEDVASELTSKMGDAINEDEENPYKKKAEVLKLFGQVLTTQNFIPIISVALGHVINPSSPFLTGVGLTLGVGGALIGLAKALENKKVDEGKEVEEPNNY